MEKTSKKVIIFGIGAHLRNQKKYVEQFIDIICYSDNDAAKWGTKPCGDDICCIPPHEIPGYKPDVVAISVQKGDAYFEIQKQLEEMGLKTVSIDALVKDYIDEYENVQKAKRKLAVKALMGEKTGNRIILVNTPEVTSTIGDHAISTAERIFLKNNFPDETIIEIGDRFFWDNREEIKENICPSDVLLIQGGGYLGSLWRMWREDTVRYILQTYTGNEIIILPQTIFFESDSEGETQKSISKLIYNSHSKLVMCFRERKSYELSKLIVDKNVETHLIPDLVLSMKYGKAKAKKSVAVFFKNDKETILSCKEQHELMDYLESQGFDTVYTTMFYDAKISSAEEREQIIMNKMEELSGYELVITDAMHGMVLSTVSGTACIGVESITGKVGGIYDWVKELPYVKYAKTIDDVKKCISSIRPYIGQHNRYVCPELDSYFDNLANMIRERLYP